VLLTHRTPIFSLCNKDDNRGVHVLAFEPASHGIVRGIGLADVGLGHWKVRVAAALDRWLQDASWRARMLRR
jgi:hypothetical protein